jgi:uncharacterized protein YhaN
MQLRELHIDGFGIFHDKSITGLSPGINIIFGRNECGKSTLFAFVKRILFGFPAGSSSANPYPALDGGTYGGSLKCQLADGKLITIARKKGTHGGNIFINGEQGSSDEIRGFFSNISKNFYENIYAIDLSELEEADFLKTEEVKEHLYSASLGLVGNVTLKEVKGTFLKKSDGIYKSGSHSSNQKILDIMNKLQESEKHISEIQSGLSNYDNLVEQRDELLLDIGMTDAKLKEQQEIVRIWENRQKLFPIFVELDTVNEELARIPEIPEFTSDSLKELEKLKEKGERIGEQIDGFRAELQAFKLESDLKNYNDQLLACEPTIIELQKNSELYLRAVKDLPQIETEKKALQDEIISEIGRWGISWTEENVKDFHLDRVQRDKIDSFKQKFKESKDKLNEIRYKIDAYKEQKALEPVKEFNGPTVLSVVSYIVAILGAAGIAVGFLLSSTVLSIFSGVILVLGIIMAIGTRKAGNKKSPDRVEKKHKEDLEAANLEKDRLDQEWQQFLVGLKLPPELSVEAALEGFSDIEKIKTTLRSLDELNGRIIKMQDTIDSVKTLHDKVAVCLGQSSLSGSIEANMDIFTQQLVSTKAIKLEKEALKKQVEKIVRQITRLEEERTAIANEIQAYLTSYSSIDETEFRVKFGYFKQSQELKDKIGKCELKIKTVTGSGEAYDIFLQSLANSNRDHIEAQLVEAQTVLDELEKEQRTKNQSIGELNNQIDQLFSSENLLTELEKAEVLKQELMDYSCEWAKAQAALFVLEKATAKYEETKQPAVIEAARGIFSQMTSGAYPKIINRVEDGEITIRDNKDKSKSINEMSRGTIGQLLLALRLGLIKVYEDGGSEPMPIVMDDIMVNFDDERGPVAIKALADFARDRQILVLTCHQNTLETYKKFGAKEVMFS